MPKITDQTCRDLKPQTVYLIAHADKAFENRSRTILYYTHLRSTQRLIDVPPCQNEDSVSLYSYF
jgi:hypothetical protein